MVYEIQPSVGRYPAQATIYAQFELSNCTDSNPYRTSQSIVSADLGTGYQDLIVPAGNCGYAVLDGRNIHTLIPATTLNDGSPYLNPICAGRTAPLAGSAATSSAIVTQDTPQTIGITVGMGSGSTGCVGHYTVASTVSTPTVGNMSWPEFHHDPKLTGALSSTLSSAQTSILGRGTALWAGNTLYSSNGQYEAVVQTTDCNFVVHPVANTSLSHGVTSSYGTPPCNVEMGTNCNAYTNGTQPPWNTNAPGQVSPPCFLIIQDDGNIVIYKAPDSSSAFTTIAANWDSPF